MENSPLILEEIEVYLDGQKVCFINQNTCEEGIIRLGRGRQGKGEIFTYVSHIEPLHEMDSNREELYEKFFEKNFSLITEAKQI